MIAPMEPRPDPTRARRERWWRSVFIILATVYVALLLLGLVLQILGGFSQIALTIFVAWLLAFILSPVVAWIHERFRVGRGVAIGLVYTATLLMGGAFLFYAAASIAANVAAMAADFPLTRVRIMGTLRTWEDALDLGRFQPNLVSLYQDIEDTLARTLGGSVEEVPEVTIGVLGGLVLVVILSLYMLADSERIIARLKRVVPTRYREEADIFERNVSLAFGGFLRAQVILAGIQTLLTVAVIVLVGLPYGFFITAASALAMLIPFFGPPLALVPPILAVAIFDPGALLLVGPLLLVVQTVLVNYLQPRLMQEALGMHPLLVLIGLLVGAQVAGVFGALFGIPVLAVLNTFFNYAVNLRTLEESEPDERDDVMEELRQQQPDAAPEELVAMAADQVEEEEAAERAEAERAAAEVEEPELASDDLRVAAGELRVAAGEQRQAAGQMGESATELREAVDRLTDEQREERG
ncbi:MAG: AI-2E family transporter [Chloroflexi bacterium]|nr:AI-2E family transporter [Chloroflexota bacterium]